MNWACGHYLPQSYTEANQAGEIKLEKGADRNYILGYRCGGPNDGIQNQGQYNFILGRFGSVNPLPLHQAPEAFVDLKIMSAPQSPLPATASGMWSFSKNINNRHLEISLTNTTGTSGDVLIKHADGEAKSGIRFSTQEDSKSLKDIKGKTIAFNFSQIPPMGSLDQSFQLFQTDSRYRLLAEPAFNVPAGIMWQTFWNGTESVIRCFKLNSKAVSVSGNFHVTAFKI